MSFDLQTSLTLFNKRISDVLQDQEWYQELRSLWHKIDPEKQFLIRMGFVVLIGLGVLFYLLQSFVGLHRLQQEVAEKEKIVQMIENGQEELHYLRALIPAQAQGGADLGNSQWPSYLEELTKNEGFSPQQVHLSPEQVLSKPIESGKSANQAEESLFQMEVEKINAKQLTRFLFALENGRRPVKIRHLKIQTLEEGAGSLKLMLSLSVFTPPPL